MKKKKPTVKILVGYHRPAVLLKDEVLIPIHLGRALATEASKDGSMSKEDYQWMLDNMIGDDTGENISEENRKYCELTALYWAWKTMTNWATLTISVLCSIGGILFLTTVLTERGGKNPGDVSDFPGLTTVMSTCSV